jgi:hypothetical protein
MCYMVRHTRAATEIGDSVPGSEPGRLRPRLVGAVAAMLFGGLALAAFVSPSRTQPVSNVSAPAAQLPLASAANTSGVVPVSVEQRSLPADDDVPSSSNLAQSGVGPCDHHGGL